MYLIAMFTRDEGSTTVDQYMGAALDIDTVLKWYRTSSRLTVDEENIRMGNFFRQLFGKK